MLDKISNAKEAVIKATTIYLRYHTDNVDTWSDEDKAVAEETVGFLILGGQKLNEFQEHYINGNTELPEGIPSEESLTQFVEHFHLIATELIKQLPLEYHEEKVKPNK